MLCLANSERIKLTPSIHMVFEVRAEHCVFAWSICKISKSHSQCWIWVNNGFYIMLCSFIALSLAFKCRSWYVHKGIVYNLCFSGPGLSCGISSHSQSLWNGIYWSWGSQVDALCPDVDQWSRKQGFYFQRFLNRTIYRVANKCRIKCALKSFVALHVYRVVFIVFFLRS